MHYYPHHIGDYQRDTAHLSMVEHGAYRLLMDAYYVTERALPLDPEALYRICRAMSKLERNAVDAVASHFFTRTDTGLIQKRIDKEIAAFQKQSETNRENGKKGGRPPKEKPKQNRPVNGSVSETGTETKGNQDPITSTQVPEPHTPAASAPPPLESVVDSQPPEQEETYTPAFEQFWAAYPNKKGKGAAFKAFKRIKGLNLPLLLQAIANQKNGADWLKDGGQYIPHPSTWLTGRHWHDEVKPAASAKPKIQLAC